MNVPYTTKSGLQIGKYYQPPKYVEEDDDMIRLQSYLIYDSARLKRIWWANRIVTAFSVLVLLVVIVKS